MTINLVLFTFLTPSLRPETETNQMSLTGIARSMYKNNQPSILRSLQRRIIRPFNNKINAIMQYRFLKRCSSKYNLLMNVFVINHLSTALYNVSNINIVTIIHILQNVTQL